MSKITCEICGKILDTRGLSGHLKTHKKTPEVLDEDGDVIVYPNVTEPVTEPINEPITEPINEPAHKVVPQAALKPTPKKQVNHKVKIPDKKPVESSEQKWKGMFGELA